MYKELGCCKDGFWKIPLRLPLQTLDTIQQEGYCLADNCSEITGDLAHMLVQCPALTSTRERLIKFWLDKSVTTPALYKFISEIIRSSPQAQTQFIVDPCQFPPIQELWNSLGQDMIDHVYYLTRTFAYYMHRAKMISLCRWPCDPGSS